MSAARGKELIIKRGAGSPNVYTTVGYTRTDGITINGESVTIEPTKSSVGLFPERLTGAGQVTVSLNADGILDSANYAQTDLLVADAINQTVGPWQLVTAAGTFTGNFQVTTFTLGGTWNGEQTFTIGLEGSGAITYA